MRRRVLISTAVSDVLSLGMAAAIASVFVFGGPLPWREQPGSWPMLTTLAAGLLLGSWISARSWVNSAPRPTYGRAVVIWASSSFASLITIVLARTYYSRPFLLLSVTIGFGLSVLHRFVRRRRPWSEDFAVVSGVKSMVGLLRDAPHANVIAEIDPTGPPPADPLPEGCVLVVDLSQALSDGLARWVGSINLAGYSVRSFTNVYEEHTGRVPIVHLAEGWELVIPVRRAKAYAVFKRVVDTIAVVLTSPVWVTISLVVALGIKMESRGPVIFRQERVGRNGKVISVLKFRTMIDGADRDGAQFAEVDDARITRIGKHLRRFRLDELPQMVNVLRGDLSIVGPRPEQETFVTEFRMTIPFYDHRHLVRPGITGWAQTHQGYAVGTEGAIEKLAYDLYYIKHMSGWLDVNILLRTFWTVFSAFGAR